MHLASILLCSYRSTGVVGHEGGRSSIHRQASSPIEPIQTRKRQSTQPHFLFTPLFTQAFSLVRIKEYEVSFV